MTKPRYQQGCSAGSQVCGETPDASDPADYAWIVNFNYGNSNINNRNNHAWVRPVRASEYQSAGISMRELYEAWQRARHQKKASRNQLRFEGQWIDNLIEMQDQLQVGSWSPARSICFVASQPKAREIHAPDFFDRVVHHWLVPQLEAIYEPTFIAQSFANRKLKGTHAAVEQLKAYARQIQSGHGGGWYLQLDIHNFFNSIHRPTLWAMLKRRLQRAALSPLAMKATHALLRHHPMRNGVIRRASPAEYGRVPPHKRLENSAPGCGLPIGNLSSQFFANVYLDALDQFVKHTLKAKRYIRYVDDFVIVHENRAQLEQWKSQIEAFLHEKLKLSLKDDVRLRQLQSGIDFLGYVIAPTHTRVRRRVVSHARQRLAEIEALHVDLERGMITATPQQLRNAASVCASYFGHFDHANSYRLKQQLTKRYPWIGAITARRRFDHRIEGRQITIHWSKR